MLVVSRKENESIRIEPAEGVDLSMTLRELFALGPIVVTVLHASPQRVRLALDAPRPLGIFRSPVAPPEFPKAVRAAEAD